jgi:hypothetical protein
MIQRLRVAVLTALLTLSLVVLGVYSMLGPTTSRAHAAGQGQPFTHQKSNVVQAILDSGDGPINLGDFKNPPSPICATTTSSATNVNTDCELIAPHNETTIAVNPTNPLNIIASANDYQLITSSGGTVKETIYSRAHVTFDGGKTWSTPARIAHGTGLLTSPGIDNDKEYLTAWGNGNAIVTWTVFNQGIKGSYISSPIFAAVTHNGGNTWTSGVEISGSASFCIGAQGGTACNQDQFSVPTVAADGSIYVAFENTANLTTGRDQYLVVKVDPSTGQRIAGPYQDSQFRTNSAGNITADPKNASHLAVVWSDMRNSPLPAPSDPYAAKTNSDIVVSQSTDGGVTWSAPTALTASGDQFMPWGAYDASGKLRIGYFDRSYDAANHKYGYTLATETSAGSLSFSSTQVTTALSDPTQGDRWFSGITVNPSFPHPSSFIGDYSGINVGANGVVLLWTDMRNTACFPPRCGFGEDAFFALH